MTASVIVPWRAAEPERATAWQFMFEWWRQQFPDLELLVAECDAENEWSKGRAVDYGVSVATGKVLILADADVMPHPRAIETAILSAVDSGWVVPYGWVYRLNVATTRELLVDGDMIRPPYPRHLDRSYLDPRRARYHGRPIGGVVVLTRDAYEAVGGIDPRFAGWGGEDLACATALRTLVNPKPTRLDLPLWHLWHPPSPLQEVNGNIPVGNSQLLVRYRKARKSRSRMRRLIAEHRGASWLADHAEDGQLDEPPARPRNV